jgi:hypothetical protein
MPEVYMKTTSFVFAFVALLFLSDAAFACRCLPRKPSADMSHSAAVFAGKVIKVRFRQTPYETGRYTVTFEVGQVWKGEAKKKITLITRASSCAVLFREGESYLVFASAFNDGNESGLTTHKCSGTGLVSDREEDIKLLGEGKIPLEGKT